MRIDVVTLFPELFGDFARIGMVGRAIARAELVLRFESPRDHGLGRHKSVDDTPYGGGAGMVMRVDVLVECLEALDRTAPVDESGAPVAGTRVLLTPQGRRFDQATAWALAAEPAVTLVCGRYEGVDDRLRRYVDRELSLGDFVLSGGEVAAMVVIDAVARLLPGVLGNPASLAEESHSPLGGGLLEYPQYTRPVEFRGDAVPEVLLSGDHGRIAAWRAEQARARTDALASSGEADCAGPGAREPGPRR